MELEEAKKSLSNIRVAIFSDYDFSDFSSFVRNFKKISEDFLGFEYGSFRVPIFKQIPAPGPSLHSVVNLTSYIDWNGDPVDRYIISDHKYTTQSSFSFDQNQPLWIVPQQDSLLLKECEGKDFMNCWHSTPRTRVNGLPQYGCVAHGNHSNNKKTSVIIPLVNYSIIGGNVDLGRKRHRFGVAIYESSNLYKNPSPEVKNILIQLSKTMLDLYLKHLHWGYTKLDPNLFIWKEY
ncbi:MAG: hypothetical protein KC643_20475 [Nitrospira sp.]|nr:hypothetical protein [Nitrospira sp.]